MNWFAKFLWEEYHDISQRAYQSESHVYQLVWLSLTSLWTSFQPNHQGKLSYDTVPGQVLNGGY